jgi:hypothetical protein
MKRTPLIFPRAAVGRAKKAKKLSKGGGVESIYGCHIKSYTVSVAVNGYKRRTRSEERKMRTVQYRMRDVTVGGSNAPA